MNKQTGINNIQYPDRSGLRYVSYIFLHIIAWIIVIVMPYFLHYPMEKGPGHNPDFFPFFVFNSVATICWAILFYINAHLFVPRLVYTKRYVLFTLIILISFALIIFIHRLIFPLIVTDRVFEIGRAIAFNIAPFGLTIAVSTTYKMLRDKLRTEQLLQRQQEENLKTELSFLRSQISPHFLFNVLNNMLALSRIKSEELEPTIIRLSSLMRYMLYETNEDSVPLQKEIDYLHHYIDLQKQRIGSRVTVNFNINVQGDRLAIAPMLLIPFIENAFKHGATGTSPVIDITLDAAGGVLHLTVFNHQIKFSREVKDNTSGIGLANVKRRLNLLYPSRHNLVIDDQPDYFSVQLQINLQQRD